MARVANARVQGIFRATFVPGQEYKTKIKWENEYCNQIRTLTVHDDIKFMYGEDKSKYFDTVVDQWLLFE